MIPDNSFEKIRRREVRPRGVVENVCCIEYQPKPAVESLPPGRHRPAENAAPGTEPHPPGAVQ